MAIECLAKFCDYDRASGTDVLFGLEKGIFTRGNGFAKGGSGFCQDAADEISAT